MDLTPPSPLLKVAPLTIAAGTLDSFPITSSPADAISSTTDGSVTLSEYPNLSFLPLYETLRRWKNGCKARVELPLFPGYVFVKINLRERFGVLSVPGAISLVGSASGAWPLPDSEMLYLRDNLMSRKFEPHPYLTVGQKVRIRSGPLAGLTGFLVRYAGGLRVVLSVDLIRQSASVEVEADDVEGIGPAPTELAA